MNSLVYQGGWVVGQCWIDPSAGVLRPGHRKKEDCSWLVGVSMVQSTGFHLILLSSTAFVFPEQLL